MKKIITDVKSKLLNSILYVFEKAIRLLPIRKGLDRITNSKIIKYLLLADGTEKLARLNTGIVMPVDLRDYNARMLKLFGHADPHVIDVCRALLKPGNCFLDIGANYGIVGMLCRNSVKPDGSVHLFEPQPNLCERIRKAKGIGIEDINLHQIGLMDRDEVVQMSLFDRHSGRGSFMLAQPGNKKTMELSVKNIASYLPPIVQHSTLGVKIDVEGAEHLLLPWIINYDRLRFVVFENQHIKQREKILNDMVQKGFTLFGLENKLLRTRLNKINNSSQYCIYKDMLAIKVDSRISTPNTLGPSQLSKLINVDE